MLTLCQSMITFVAITLQMLIVGHGINHLLRIWNYAPEGAQNKFLKMFFDLSMGLALDTTVLFILGIAGWFTPLISIIALSGITILSAFTFKLQRPSHFQNQDIIIFIALLIFYVIIFCYAIHPPGRWDDTSYHLPIAKFYLQEKQIILQPYLRFPLFPQNMNLILALGLMMGNSQISSEIIAQSLATLPVFIAGLGLIGVLLYATSTIWPGFIACFVLLILPPIQKKLGYAYIDSGLMLYCWGTLLAVAFSVTHSKNSDSNWRSPWLLVAGILAGMAIGTKYFGLVLVCFPGLWLLIVRRDWRSTLIYGCVAFIFGCWWYIRSWLISGDPFHPAGGNLFGHFLWNADDLIGQTQEQRSHGVSKHITSLVSAIIKAQLEPFFLLPLSFIYWRRLKPGMSLIFCSTLCYFFFWFYVTQVARYLMPIMAPAIFFIMWSFWEFCQTIKSRLSNRLTFKPIFHRIITLLCILPLGIMATSQFIKSQSRFVHWNEILQTRNGYTLMQEANNLIPIYGKRIINAGFVDIYYYDGIAIGDIFGLGRYSQMIQCGKEKCSMIPPRDLKEVMKYHHTNMLLVNLKSFNIDLPSYQKEFIVRKVTSEGILFSL